MMRQVVGCELSPGPEKISMDAFYPSLTILTFCNGINTASGFVGVAGKKVVGCQSGG
jgi:hypothetical protein